ncbi:MAG TPA: antitoxin Xre/MbcA/ParS toxin-binding domain-containing protein [Oligoflexus sp.]|uniref:antitoxin Xre/MbcA/ParS toxin-binding domain-containing protein n=1 Tax=Oligoflexus sp. TaxID=1971216 RepID=UPI002D53A48A|nr:antitoxin Xre/MbcA/ParS toxin-binding domain-containing protein [Oligoflexus sp.]HYX37592.1 antitoxin Xre/MbcA/ParS toxin-binding domain-containing protein [Oligoflexus sp.]
MPQTPVETKRPSPEQLQKVLGTAFWNIAEHYGFTQKDIALILGIKENRQRLAALKKELVIPEDPDKLLRVSHLVGIHKNLRILFPHNREVVYAWLKTPRELFQGRSALEFIAEDPMQSMTRLFTVRRLLDQLRISA